MLTDAQDLIYKVPLSELHGTIRVGNTRVTLASVVASFEQGATPEHIVEQFDTLKLEDVYGVLAYYLHHRSEVQAYLKEYYARGETLRQTIEVERPTKELRQRILKSTANSPEEGRTG